MKFLNDPFINLKKERYLNWIIIIAPLLNFLSGLNVDLYAPSMPAIAHHYDVSIMLVKNTISANMVGFAIGCVIFGILIDVIGRRTVISFGLFVFIIASILAIVWKSMTGLMVARFLQGMMVSTVSIGCRALAVDHFTGKRFAIAILYTSVAFGSGPVIGPFIGGLLQYHFGWQANFVAYIVFAAILLLLFLLIVGESLTKPKCFSLQKSIKQYRNVITHAGFFAGVMILAGVVLEQIVYPTVGPFVVEHVMHRTAIAYGNSALFAGFSYLLGTLINRTLIHKLSQRELIYIGLALLLFAVLVQLSFSLELPLNLFTLVFPVLLVGFASGFIFPNVLSTCLQFFPKNAGIAGSVQAGLMVILIAVGVFAISHFNITRLIDLTPIYATLVFLQIIIFFVFFKKHTPRVCRKKT